MTGERGATMDGLVIAWTTAVLGAIVSRRLSGSPLGMVAEARVSARPPDRLSEAQDAGINLFMYFAETRALAANVPPAHTSPTTAEGETLALDLHYLVSAYGANELDAEALLGMAMQLFYETPALTREAISAVLSAKFAESASNRPVTREISSLTERVENVRIVPSTHSIADLARLWVATGASLRPSAAYRVSVILGAAPSP